jgi:hypothetical protein
MGLLERIGKAAAAGETGRGEDGEELGFLLLIYLFPTWALMGQMNRNCGLHLDKQVYGETGTGSSIPDPPPLDPTGTVVSPFSPPWG